MKEKSQFASHSLLEHVLRGLGGTFFLIWAIGIANTSPIGSLILGALMIFVFRGCPMCWLIGLFETVYATVIRYRAKNLM